MGKRTVLFLIVALVALAIVPAVASADLVNEYGMHFAGQSKCLECHDGGTGATVHGRMARTRDLPGRAERLDHVQGRRRRDARCPAPKVPYGTRGGTYALDLPWVTLGDNTAGLAHGVPLLEGRRTGADPTVMPWNLVEGLALRAEEGGWMSARARPVSTMWSTGASAAISLARR